MRHTQDLIAQYKEEDRTWTRIVSTAAAFIRNYVGYIVLLVIFLVRQHDSHIKSRALLTLYYAERVEDAIVQMESSQRGYLFTGDPDLANDFSRSEEAYQSSAHDLDLSLAPDEANRNLFHHSQSVAAAKIAEMKQTLKLATSGKVDEARELMRTRQGQRYMAEVRDDIREIRSSKEIQAIAAMSAF